MRIHLAVLSVFLSCLLSPAVRSAELIMFEEPGCVWCARWHAEVGPGYPKSEEGQIAPLYRHDIRNGTPSGVRLERPVTSTPTFVLVDDGAELGRITGYPGPDYFYPLLEKLLKRLPTPAPATPAPSQRDARAAIGPVAR